MRRFANNARAPDVPSIDTFCLAIGKAVSGEPEAIKVATVEGQNLIVVELTAPPSEVGRLVGRDGRTIGAIRTLAEQLGTRFGKRVMVDVQAAGGWGTQRRP